MTTKKTFKKLVSFLLAVIMMFSVMTTAFAAETDVAQTSATITGGLTFYLKPSDGWKSDGARFAAFFCNGSTGDRWYSAYGPNDDGNYWVTVNAGESHANIIWCRMDGANTTNNWDNRWNQTGDLTWDGSNNLFTISTWDNQTSGWSSYTPTTPTEPDETEEPTDPVDPVDKITISFLLNTDTKWVHTDDAKMFIKSGSEIIEMDETIDTKSGHVMWTADVAENSSYTFYRTSYFFDESNAASKPWNTWTASGRNTNTVYKATGSGVGSWVAQSTVNAADPTDITNFWDDLWIDTKGEGKPEDAVKVYYTGSTFHLYVPSYVDLSDVTVYSDHEKVVIGGKEYASGTKANLTTGQHTFAFKDGSTTTNKGNITIYQTESTAAMLMTTKEELFTGTTAGLANDNAWPSGSGITSTNYNGVYKDAIETKGSYYFYDEEGNLVNSDPVLKKIKGRGNSSFEASMKLYGKYAYNFNLDSKVALIDGSTASKKWCLLANNPDITMMRNTFIYSLADDVGLKYGPETRLLDLYDNGKYLGSYILTEKVEYGKNTLMSDMKNLDDGNADANSVMHPTDEEADPLYEFDTDDLDDGVTGTYTVNGQKYQYKYYATYDRPAYKDENGNTVAAAPDQKFLSANNYNTKYNFLLEWELYNRYENEASWFVSPRTGQAVVVKYPEFATQEEMQWIIAEYEAAESAIYNNNTEQIKAEVDVDSFARMYLIQELALNLDSCATSYYVHNDLASGKLVASPVWDYDWSLGAYSNTTNSGKKFKYNGSTVVVNSTTMDNPKQMFVKDKALKTDAGDNTKKANYNFQAKLVHNEYVWERCQYYWTNLFVPNLNRYVDNDYLTGSVADDGKTEGRILAEWLPRFESSMAMNNARWGSVNFTGDNWGTKITTNYNNRSFNFYVGQNTAGTASKSYANSVYYLNDWIVERWNYMSSSTGGNLYNEELKATYEITDVTFEGVQDSTDDTQLTVTPSATVTMNGVAVDAADIIWNVYVNGTLAYSSNFTEESHTVTLASGANEVYVVVGVKDTDESVESSVQTFNTYVPNYTIDNVTFKAEQSADESQLTVTPSAVAKLDGVELTASQYQYTIYLNGKVVAGPVTFETVSTTINLEEGKVNEVYIVVTPVGVTTVSAKSATEKFAYAVEVEKVQATLYFKSSSSLRYRPYVSVAGADKVEMTKSGSAIGKNASQTQSYYWYTATVEIDKDKATKLTFTNSYAMNGVVTVTLSEDADALYFGVDNLNDGAVAENLTDASEYVRNFTKSSTHMVHNDAYDPAGVATTSIDGTIYKMGDADGDNVVSVMDSTTMQRALAGKTELSETNSALADFDLNEVNSIMDATKVQTALVA